MVVHRLGSAPDTLTEVFSRDLPPVLTVDAGDTVVVRTLDGRGHLERQRTPGEPRPHMFDPRHGHCLVGPIAIRGAQPGMVLAVHLVSLRTDDWGWTEAKARDNALNRRLGIAGKAPSWLLWDLDPDARTGTNDRGHTVDLAPFLGVIGLPPNEPGEHRTIPPRACGGNIDCRELVAGSTLYLPVTVAGGLLCVGDGHAAQADGEVAGTAIECGMTTEMVLDLVTAPPIATMHALTPTSRLTFGFSEDLNEATAQALDAMLCWMQLLFDLDKAAALALASVTVDLRITQIVNEVWGVHAVLPLNAVRLPD